MENQGISKQMIFIAITVSLGGFLFGFDAGIISGVMNFATPYLELTDDEVSRIVSAPTLAAMFTMLVAGRLSDYLGRRILLKIVAFLYAVSAIWSAYAGSYETLYYARVLGGLAFGSALVIAPSYIAEIASAEKRGTLVSVQQLNIVLGFFAAFLCNYYLNELNNKGAYGLTDENVWRWMLGIEFAPAVLYLLLLFFVPRSPRWLMLKGQEDEAKDVLDQLHGPPVSEQEFAAIQENIQRDQEQTSTSFVELFSPALSYILWVGIAVGILQQITGINAVYFYATSIFKQLGIGTDAAFASGVWLSLTSVVFTVVAMITIDRFGRRPLLLFGIGGIALSMLLCFWGFKNATYTLELGDLLTIEGVEVVETGDHFGKTFDNDVDFKNAMKSAFGDNQYNKYEGEILEKATTINGTIVMVGILVFVACFAFSLGPVMWVMLSELYPNRYRGLAIGFIGFINGFASWLVARVFPWELANLGNATTFLIYGLIAAFGFLLFLKILPETRGKSLEEIEAEFVK
ncbi:MAG: sugar porter family MFS transporter [Bacteroidota bacterium]